MKRLAIAFTISALFLSAAFAQTGGGAGGVQPGSTGRLGTTHPNAAAGPLRAGRTATQTGPSDGTRQAGIQPRGQIVVPGQSLELQTGSQRGGPTVPPIGGQAVPPVDGQVVPPVGTAPVPPIAGQAGTPLGTQLGGQAGVVRDDQNGTRFNGQTGAPFLGRPGGGVAQVYAPLRGDLEFGVQQGEPLAGERGLGDQRLGGGQSGVEQREARFGTRDRAIADRQARAQSFGGRWWFQRNSGEWLIYDERTGQWRPFDPRRFAR